MAKRIINCQSDKSKVKRINVNLTNQRKGQLNKIVKNYSRLSTLNYDKALKCTFFSKLKIFYQCGSKVHLIETMMTNQNVDCAIYLTRSTRK